MGIFKLITGALWKGAGYAIKGVKGSAEIARSKADVAVAEIEMQSRAAHANVDLAKILNSRQGLIKEILHLIVILVCLFLLLDVYFTHRGMMSDDVILYFLGFSTTIIGSYFGVKAIEGLKMPETIRAQGQAVKLEAEAKVEHKKAELLEMETGKEAAKALGISELRDKALCKELMWVDVFRSQTAAKHNWLNFPVRHKKEIFKNLEWVGVQVLDKAMAAYRVDVGQAQIKLNCHSGYRCKLVNDAVGSNDKSNHLWGQAVDVSLLDNNEGVDLAHFFSWLKKNSRKLKIPIHQCLFESKGLGKNKITWLHIASRRRGFGVNKRDFGKLHNGNRILD